MKGLTKRQREIVDYIQEFITNNRYSPSYREIGNHFGFKSVGSVAKHINALKRKEALSNDYKTSRSVTPSDRNSDLKPQNSMEIPFIGHLTAGIPIQIFSQTRQITIPRSFIADFEKTYALKIQGDSLHEELLADGDIVVIEARPQAESGETVIALINGHDTILKKYYPEGDFVRLIGSYSHHNPILLRQEDVIIQGVIIGVLRQF